MFGIFKRKNTRIEAYELASDFYSRTMREIYKRKGLEWDGNMASFNNKFSQEASIAQRIGSIK